MRPRCVTSSDVQGERLVAGGPSTSTSPHSHYQRTTSSREQGRRKAFERTSSNQRVALFVPTIASISLSTALASPLASLADVTDATVATVTASAERYVPSPMDMSWQIYVGTAVGIFPFIIATYEFSKRVIIQRRCQVCNGTGLVLKGKSAYYKKCRECGGFLPWLGWRAFFTGSFTGIANGSPVLPPKGQTTVLYKVPEVPKTYDDHQETEKAASVSENKPH